MKRILFITIASLPCTLLAAESLYTNWTFDDNNVIYTNVLQKESSSFVEPTKPNDTQKGPSWVAKGKPFYIQNGDPDSPHAGWTVAPGSQYQIGFESSCKRIGTSDECKRDNAITIEVYGDSETKEDGGVQDKAFLQLFDVSRSDSLYVVPNGQTIVHNLNFDMKFDKYYEISKSGPMHMQSFQPGCGPALSMKTESWDFKKGGNPVQLPIKLYFEVRRNRPDLSIETLKVCELEVKRDEWTNLYLKMAPGSGRNSTRNLGRLFIYRNGQRICEFSDNWGTHQANGIACNQGHRIDIGTYGGRTKQRRKVIFDNVRYGTDYEATRFGESRVTMPFSDPN